MISDLLGKDPLKVDATLQQAVSWPAETHVIQILDPREIRPDLEGEIRLIDVETEELRRVWLDWAGAAVLPSASSENWLEQLVVQRVCRCATGSIICNGPTDTVRRHVFLETSSRAAVLVGREVTLCSK